MEKKDHSKLIYDKYYNSDGRILQVFLKDGSVLEGIFIGFFHGDTEIGEPFIIKWDFVPASVIGKHHSLALSAGKMEYRKIVRQEEIERVQFKKGQ